MDGISKETSDGTDSSSEGEGSSPQPTAGCPQCSASEGQSQCSDCQIKEFKNSSSDDKEDIISVHFRKYRSAGALKDVLEDSDLHELPIDSENQNEGMPGEKRYTIEAEVHARDLQAKKLIKLRRKCKEVMKSLKPRIKQEEPRLEVLEELATTPKAEGETFAFDLGNVPQAVDPKCVPLVVDSENVVLKDDPESMPAPEISKTEASVKKSPKKSKKCGSTKTETKPKVQKVDEMERAALQYEAQFENRQVLPITTSSSEAEKLMEHFGDFLDIHEILKNVRNRLLSKLESKEYDFGPVWRHRLKGLFNRYEDRQKRMAKARKVRKREIEKTRSKLLAKYRRRFKIRNIGLMIKSFIAATKIFNVTPEELAKQMNGKKLKRKRSIYLSDRKHYRKRYNRAQKTLEAKLEKVMTESKRIIEEYVNIALMTEGDLVYNVDDLMNELVCQGNKQRKLFAKDAAKRMLNVRKSFYRLEGKFHAMEAENSLCDKYRSGFLAREVGDLCRLNADFGFVYDDFFENDYYW